MTKPLTSPSFPNGLVGNRTLAQAKADMDGDAPSAFVGSLAEYRPEHFVFQREQSAALKYREWEKSPAPIKDYEKQIGGFLAGFIPLAWYFLLIALGVAK